MPRLIVNGSRWLAITAVITLLTLISIWAYLALWFDFPIPNLRIPLSIALAVWIGVFTIRYQLSWKTVSWVSIPCLTVWISWLFLQPKQERNWQPEVAVTSFATISGDIITLHQVRNNLYQTDTNFSIRRETRQYNLRHLRGIDLFINYWGSPAIAHPITSFDFGKDGRICFSIETRPERHESYSAIKGLFRQYELYYNVADEHDVIPLRTHYRKGESVYLYHVNTKDPQRHFLEFINTLNELHTQPQWYNAITRNCTTSIRYQDIDPERPTWDWRMLVNGYADQMLYERGILNQSLPFAELKQKSLINSQANSALNANDFSEQIRNDLPGSPRD